MLAGGKLWCVQPVMQLLCLICLDDNKGQIGKIEKVVEGKGREGKKWV